MKFWFSVISGPLRTMPRCVYCIFCYPFCDKQCKVPDKCVKASICSPCRMKINLTMRAVSAAFPLLWKDLRSTVISCLKRFQVGKIFWHLGKHMARHWISRCWFWARNHQVVGLAGAERIWAKVIHDCTFVTQCQQFWSSYSGTLLQDLNLWFSIQIHSSKLGACISFLERTLEWMLLTISCLSRGVRLGGYSQPSESFNSCLARGGRPLVSQLIHY